MLHCLLQDEGLTNMNGSRWVNCVNSSSEPIYDEIYVFEVECVVGRIGRRDGLESFIFRTRAVDWGGYLSFIFYTFSIRRRSGFPTNPGQVGGRIDADCIACDAFFALRFLLVTLWIQTCQKSR
jgi:hypothetical protein